MSSRTNFVESQSLCIYECTIRYGEIKTEEYDNWYFKLQQSTSEWEHQYVKVGNSSASKWETIVRQYEALYCIWIRIDFNCTVNVETGIWRTINSHSTYGTLKQCYCGFIRHPTMFRSVLLFLISAARFILILSESFAHIFILQIYTIYVRYWDNMVQHGSRVRF